MSPRKIVGLVLAVLGLVVLVWGGVFWTNEKTVVDAGPLQVTTSDRDGVSVPPVVGAVALIGGILMFVLPDRRRV
jgi:drug/metabolite transporter (DMT)-like permease